MKAEVKATRFGPEMLEIIEGCYYSCIEFLDSFEKVDLISKVEGKSYFAFTNGKKLSRAINTGLYNTDPANWKKLKKLMETNAITVANSDSINSTLYTMAISFCAASDINSVGDQKTPGTFFEYFVAYFFTWRVGVQPENRIKILNIDDEIKYLPTDFIFNLGAQKQKYHMPIKTSTRERSIMLWAHQRLIDGVYGNERFMGTPVLLAETKLDSKKREVVEICLPDQWRIYQLYVAKLKRIYYLDVPYAYKNLNSEFPPLAVKQFSDFFWEWDKLAPI
jgi:hypothetical protein